MTFRKLGIIAAIAACVFSLPAAAADFTGPRVGVNVGVVDDDFGGTDDATYGINVGYDVAVSDSVIVGASAEYQDGFENFTPRELAASARIGTKVTDKALLYASGGYTNLRLSGVDIDGYRLGGGIEVGVSDNVSLNVESRFADYGSGAELYQTLVGAVFRF